VSSCRKIMSDERINPQFSRSQAAEMVKRLYGLSPGNMDPLPSYHDQNFYVPTEEGGEYILKIFNFVESQNLKRIGVQMQAMSFLRQNGLPVPTAVPTNSGQISSLEEADFGCGCRKYLVILLTFLPGTVISKVPLTAPLLFEAGKTAARMDTILQKFQHPFYDELRRDNFLWCLSNIPMLEEYLQVAEGEPLKEIVEGVIRQFRTSVIPKTSSFHSALIHGDFNDLNLLVLPDDNGGHRISGILDFNDLHLACSVYELAICIMYLMLEHPNPMVVGGLVLAGWETVLPLNQAEKDCLYVLVMSRFCQSCLLARHEVILHPENAEYLMTTSKTGVSILRQLWELGKEEVESVWFKVAAEYSCQNTT
uniref:Hydroxylysine kinase n=1 Tax=Tetraodon nigroviridis TaxID=99883 RepID=H3C4A0_TETNG